MKSRIGIGYDIHALVSGRKLVIGGIRVPYQKGLKGHSDSDVLLHAIIDALLGAMGEGDIGDHFPDTNPKYRDISSLELLKSVGVLLRRKGFTVGNIDAIVIAQEPKLFGFKKQMQAKISGVLKISLGKVNIKAKTNEGLDSLGKKKAISSYAVAVINKETRR